MKLFIMRESHDTSKNFRDDIRILRSLYCRPKLYLIGELGIDWELVNIHDLDGLVKTPEAIKPLLDMDKEK